MLVALLDAKLTLKDDEWKVKLRWTRRNAYFGLNIGQWTERFFGNIILPKTFSSATTRGSHRNTLGGWFVPLPRNSQSIIGHNFRRNGSRSVANSKWWITCKTNHGKAILCVVYFNLFHLIWTFKVFQLRVSVRWRYRAWAGSISYDGYGFPSREASDSLAERR